MSLSFNLYFYHTHTDYLWHLWSVNVGYFPHSKEFSQASCVPYSLAQFCHYLRREAHIIQENFTALPKKDTIQDGWSSGQKTFLCVEGHGASIAFWEHATISQVNNFTVIVYGLSDDFLTLLEAGLNLPF